jgi:hypothetical protein
MREARAVGVTTAPYPPAQATLAADQRAISCIFSVIFSERRALTRSPMLINPTTIRSLITGRCRTRFAVMSCMASTTVSVGVTVDGATSITFSTRKSWALCPSAVAVTISPGVRRRSSPSGVHDRYLRDCRATRRHPCAPRGEGGAPPSSNGLAKHRGRRISRSPPSCRGELRHQRA